MPVPLKTLIFKRCGAAAAFAVRRTGLYGGVASCGLRVLCAQVMARGHAGQSFRLACLSDKNSGVFRLPAIERPSFGRSYIGLQKFGWGIAWGRFCKNAVAGYCVPVMATAK